MLRLRRTPSRDLGAGRPFPATPLLAALLGFAAAGASAADFDAWTRPARYEFSYRVDLAQLDAAPGDRLSLWLPLPGESTDQHLIGREVEAPFEVGEAVDALGNRIARLAWHGPAPAGSSVVVRATLERRPSHPSGPDGVVAGGADDPARYLGPARRIPLDGVIAQLGAQQSRGLESDGEKIRAFYDYVVHTMRYSKEGDGWGRGDAVWACSSKYGNCTDFHSVFLGMARSQGIPARFVIGFPLSASAPSGDVGGYHCWAEAWDPERGWLPIDASEAWKAGRPDDYFGALPSDRIAMSIGRDLLLVPPQQGPPLNFFVYPYAERNGVPVEDVKGQYHYRRVEPPSARSDP
jgi:transglutaminase-like putative cysteine protease